MIRVERHIAGGGQAAVIYGSEGVGKTRLAREVLTRAERRKFATILAVATPSAASIPFAALAGVLPAVDAPDDMAGMIRACRNYLDERTASRPLVILIDDAHWLDHGSLSLLPHLFALPGVRLLLTIRADAPAPGEITGLWKDDLGLRVDLEPLDRVDCERLVALTLGGPAHPATGEVLWELSRGNPMFLRELLLGARELGHLVERHGSWELTQPPAVTPRLTDLVSSRLEEIDERPRLGLEALTLIEPFGVVPFLEMLGPATVERLESTQTVEVVPVGRRRQVRFAHPVYGEVVRSTTPHGKLVHVAELLLEIVADRYVSRRTDPAMLAGLWSVAGRSGRPELFTEAARQALSASDHAAAEELAASAVDRGGGIEAQLTFGEALVYRGRSEQAELALATAATTATSDEQIARTALLRAHSELFNRGDPAHAHELAGEARRDIEDEGWRDQLDGIRALAAAMQGDFVAAVEAATPVREREDPEPRVLLAALTVSTVAHALLGDIEAARRDVRRAAPLLEPLREALPLASDQIRIVEVLAELHDARVATAVTLADDAYVQALEAGMAGQVGAWAVTLATASVMAGDLARAGQLAEQAAGNLEVADPLGLGGTALGLRALCAAALGDLESAVRWLEPLDAGRRRDLRTRINAERAEVWLTAARGDLQHASALAAECGQWAVEATYHVWGALTLHDAVRFGHAALVSAKLVDVSAGHDSGLLQLFADHAGALEAQDPDALRDVAQRFEEGGAKLYAAEVLAQTADACGRLGQPRAAETAELAAAELLGRVGDVVTPALLRSPDPLTIREREIAIMARRGMASRAIADELLLSPRTVDNHLASIYRKAGIDGRHQLDELSLGQGQRPPR